MIPLSPGHVRRRRLKNAAGLPLWYRWENYRQALGLDARGWLTQLGARLSAYAPGGGEGFFTGLVPETAWMACQSPAAVRSLSVSDAHWLALDVLRGGGFLRRDELERLLEEGASGVDSPFDQIEAPYRSRAVGVVDPSREREALAALMVDLAAPDEVLEGTFRCWLESTRAARAALGRGRVKRRFTPADFNRWASNGVLPYLDLTRWAALAGVRIPHWLMGEALFPGPNAGDRASRVSKTTKPLAERLLGDWGVVEALEKQAQAQGDVLQAVEKPTRTLRAQRG